MWKDNHKHKLITKVVTNLVIFQASKIGRAPTKSDVINVIDTLKIKVSDAGVLDTATLKQCSWKPFKDYTSLNYLMLIKKKKNNSYTLV